jgi:hypothetical protein
VMAPRHVSIYPGGEVTWKKTAKPLEHYWEIDVTSAAQEPVIIGQASFQIVTVSLEGWMVWHHQNPNTAKTWRGILKRIVDRLTASPTLAGLGVDGFTARGAEGLPQITTNNRVDFADGSDVPLCNHAVITIQYRRMWHWSALQGVP